MLINRDNKIENEDVNLDKDAQGTASTQSACLRASLSVSTNFRTTLTNNGQN